METFFTSDTHFGHGNVLKYSKYRKDIMGITEDEWVADKRAAAEKMNEWIISKWNEMISKDDMVYILGDFSLYGKQYNENILKRLNGRKILIRGNHDIEKAIPYELYENVYDLKSEIFTSETHSFIEKGELFRVEMCHYPLLSWRNRERGSMMLHGHVHGGLDDYNSVMDPMRLDVGIDGKFGNCLPINLRQIYEYYNKIKPFLHND